METKLVVIGNSQGVRLPKTIVDACGIVLEQPLRIEVRGGAILLSPLRGARAGWAEAARSAAAQNEDLWAAMPPGNVADDDWSW